MTGRRVTRARPPAPTSVCRRRASSSSRRLPLRQPEQRAHHPLRRQRVGGQVAQQVGQLGGGAEGRKKRGGRREEGERREGRGGERRGNRRAEVRGGETREEACAELLTGNGDTSPTPLAGMTNPITPPLHCPKPPHCLHFSSTPPPLLLGPPRHTRTCSSSSRAGSRSEASTSRALGRALGCGAISHLQRGGRGARGGECGGLTPQSQARQVRRPRHFHRSFWLVCPPPCALYTHTHTHTHTHTQTHTHTHRIHCLCATFSLCSLTHTNTHTLPLTPAPDEPGHARVCPLPGVRQSAEVAQVVQQHRALHAWGVCVCVGGGLQIPAQTKPKPTKTGVHGRWVGGWVTS